jgi:hypothetical protein
MDACVCLIHSPVMDRQLVGRLAVASTKKFFIPERDVDWEVPIGEHDSIVPLELLSIYGLDTYQALSHEQRQELTRHEVACMLSFAIRLEAVLVQRFAESVRRDDPLDPYTRYCLHEVEEEARHSRMFARVIERLGVGAYRLEGLMGTAEGNFAALTRSKSFFFLFTLAAEELPDTFFKTVSESPLSHPILRQISLIHRIEEARHIRFGREAFRGLYEKAGALERAAIRATAPVVVRLMFDGFVRPDVYLRAGVAASRLEAWRLWNRGRHAEHRVALRARAAARLTKYLEDVGVIDRRSRSSWVAWGLLQDGV